MLLQTLRVLHSAAFAVPFELRLQLLLLSRLLLRPFLCFVFCFLL